MLNKGRLGEADNVRAVEFDEGEWEIRSPSDGLLLPPLQILSARRVKAAAEASVSRGQRCDGWLRGEGAVG